MRPKAKGERELELLTHELIHVADWKLEEKRVRVIAAEVSRILYRELGYRRPRA